MATSTSISSTLAAGAVLKPLTTDPAVDSGPILSPDRSSVVYDACDGPNREHRVAGEAVDGTGGSTTLRDTPRRLRRTPNRAAWNPIHSDLLAVLCVDAAGRSNLQIVRLDGQVLRVLDPGTERFEDVAYSPDGRTLVLWGTDAAGVDGGSLYLVQDDGSGPPVQLTDEHCGYRRRPDVLPRWTGSGVPAGGVRGRGRQHRCFRDQDRRNGPPPIDRSSGSRSEPELLAGWY